MPNWMDHLLILFLLVVVPINGYLGYRRLIQRLASEEPGVRLRQYRTTILAQWTILAIVLALWIWRGRQLGGLGIALPLGWQAALGVAMTLAMASFLVVQWRAIRELAGPALERLRQQLEGASALIPRTDQEGTVFRGLALTAGVCEEVVYRGYLIWYFAAWLGPWPAVAVTGCAFGLAHFYQGRSGVAKTALVGVLMGALYVATGSLLWPMVVHAMIDLHGGAVGRKVVAGSTAAT